MKKSEMLAGKLVQKITFDLEYGWPPVCSGIFYQPERPVENNAESCAASSSDNTED